MTEAVIRTQKRALVTGKQEAKLRIAGGRPYLRGTRVSTVIERQAGEQGEYVKNARI